MARVEWERITPILEALGLLSPLDRSALAAYCQTYARWVAAEMAMQGMPLVFKSPTGYPQQSPWLSIANKQLEILARYLTEFGLSPSSRQRLDLGDAEDRLAWVRGSGMESGAAPDAGNGERRWPGGFDPLRPMPKGRWFG